MSLRVFKALSVLSFLVIATVAAAEQESIVVRTAKIDNHVVVMTPDKRLFGVHCGNQELVFATPSGEIMIDNYKTAVRNANPRSGWISLEARSSDLLCRSPLNTEFDLVISEGSARILASRSAKLESYTDEAEIRTYKFGQYLIGVTDNYRLVGLDCRSGVVSQIIDHTIGQISTGYIVMQKDNGLLIMKNYTGGRMGIARASSKVLSSEAVSTICGSSRQELNADYDVSGILSANLVEITGRSVNARAKK